MELDLLNNFSTVSLQASKFQLGKNLPRQQFLGEHDQDQTQRNTVCSKGTVITKVPHLISVGNGQRRTYITLLASVR